jgi:hypothetical protein
MGNQINNLVLASTYFIIKYNEMSDEITNLRKVKTLRAETDILEPKFYEREYNANESGYGVLIRKQERGPRLQKEDNRRICSILEKEVINGLGMVDSYYYYIIYRNRLLNSWANAFELKKYFRTPGIYLPFSILKHIESNKLKHTSELVLMYNPPDVNPKLYSIKSADLFKFCTSNKLPLIISAYGEYTTAIPFELLGEFKVEN